MDLVDSVEAGKLTIRELIDALVKDKNYTASKWEQRYREFTTLLQQTSTFAEPETDDLVKRLWYERDNGIASIRQGVPSLAEYQQSLPLLRELTERVRQQPNEATYQYVGSALQQAKEIGQLKRMYWSLRNRVFAAFSPENYTSTVDENAFNKAAEFLNQRFHLGLVLTGNWLQKNYELKQAIHAQSPDTDPYYVNMAIWHIYELLRERDNEQKQEKVASSEPIENKTIPHSPTNVIFFGPPGTGKTFTLQQKMKEYTSHAVPADREAWLDSRLESLNWMQVITLVLLDLGKLAKVRQIIEHIWFRRKALLNGRNGNLSNTAWEALQAYTIPESLTVNYKNRREPAVFDKTGNSEWFLVDSQLEQVEDLLALHAELKRGPKSAEAIQRFAVVTFHQSYGYEEFIEGMRARSDESGNISYPIEPGIFMRLCQRANADPAHRYAIFIDEINRGNISKIFGELISLIEVDKRAGMPDAMSLQLSYSGEHFSVPANVDIIGAMNTADRSLALLDTALRRRFDFVEMMPDLSLLSGAKVKGIELESLLEKLNSRIEALYDREHTLGHAFFMPVKNALDTGDEETAFKQLKIAFQKKIIPLLQEYFFDDWNKIRLVLADNQKQDDNQQFVIEKTDDLDTLFGNNHGLRRHNQQSTTYELKDFDQGVWNMPKAYRSIYQPQRTTPDEQVVNHE
ncbi:MULTISPECIES: McrB family protein [Enterobacteriaceae]|mgnify:FL=1|jgi:5-methylcytosine-specific restriction protein B|uniref:McrB family protein n=1 Tax=Enterobacteriaceae TaxID=543 RepID=UPI00025C73BD|nr:MULTISPECIES: AAA family ATPase [Enterobacteriaceae]EFE2143553.1 AAA domain-containing protein [Escherichia coli O8:H19]EHY2142022.1 AAA family ATPase [Escherichia coli O157]EKF4424518.1 AAA family ATPase [Escherichia coli O8]EEC8745210.1 AAA domain-containing protein [Escherichia coli]EEC9265188.1 AAA domain-containing protein [Escherichia coli]